MMSGFWRGARNGSVLIRETPCWKNRCHRNLTGVVFREARPGLRPAFCDTTTGAVYPSQFVDGRPAPVHVFDGLPDSVVQQRTPDGRVAALKETIVAGFLHAGCFFTREEAALILNCPQHDTEPGRPWLQTVLWAHTP